MWPGLPIGEIKRLSLGMSQFTIEGDPSPEAWKRVQRYASWIHRVYAYDWWAIAEDTYHKFRLNSPADGWFPALQELSWGVTGSNLPHLSAWHTEGPPPAYSASLLPLSFPPLVELILGGGAARRWFSLFERLEDHIPPTQDVTPLIAGIPEHQRPPQSHH